MKADRLYVQCTKDNYISPTVIKKGDFEKNRRNGKIRWKEEEAGGA